MEAVAPEKLSMDTLSWEPMRMVNTALGSHMSNIITIKSRELSALDMLFEDEYGSAILFYDVVQARMLQVEATLQAAAHSWGSSTGGPVARLQEALAELLVYYPCAAGVLVHRKSDGRLEVRYPTYINSASNGTHVQMKSTYTDHPSIIGYGVHFHVAHADLTLADLGDLSIPHPSLNLLYPRKPSQGFDSNGLYPLPRFVMAFQITTFKCGGFSIAHTCSHAYADGFTVATFLQNLCSLARGAGLANPPDIVPSRKEVFAARDGIEPPTTAMQFNRLDKLIQARKRSRHSRCGGGSAASTGDAQKQLHSISTTATRVVFDLDALGALKKRILEEEAAGQLGTLSVKSCSRNQVVMAILWIAHARVRMEVLQGNINMAAGCEETILRFPVNLRKRVNNNTGANILRGLTRGYVGNAIVLCSVYATLGEICESSVSRVVGKIVKAVESLDLEECVQSLVDYLDLQLSKGLVPTKVASLRMPSMVGLPFYDTDCGWGPPTYISRPCFNEQHQPIIDRYIILDHPAADAWNVLAAFRSPLEQACFQKCVAQHIPLQAATTPN